MTTEQAIAILDRAASLAPMSRADHAAVIKAIEVLRAAVASPPNQCSEHEAN